MLLILVGEGAAARHADAEAGEEVAADHVAFGDLGRCIDTDRSFAIVAKRNVSHDFGECRILTTKSFVNRPGEGRI